LRFGLLRSLIRKVKAFDKVRVTRAELLAVTYKLLSLMNRT
jgi:hypothetical protein